MSLLAITSAKGAPGVTSLALLLASLETKVPTVLVEADEVGSALTARFTLDHQRGIASLYRRAFDKSLFLKETQLLAIAPNAPTIGVAVGISSEGRRQRLADFWREFGAAAAADTETYYVVDCGRYATESPIRSLVEQADLTLFVTRPTIEDALHTELLVRRLKSGGILHNADVVVVGDGAYGLDEIAQSLSIPVIAGLPADIKAAAVLAGTIPADTRFAEFPLVKEATRLHAYVKLQCNISPRLEESA